MIARLKGILDSIGEDHLVIDVQGVGYLVQCSAKTLARLPEVGTGLTLEIETRLREDALQLFGFLSAEERAWFRLLQDVQGVGAKVALSILSALSPRDLWQAVRQGDKTALSRAPGVGPKLAARLAMELKDKAPPFAEAPGGAPPIVASVPSGAASEAASALVNLGYKAGDAERAVQAAMAKAEAGTAVAQVIRLALRELAR